MGRARLWSILIFGILAVSAAMAWLSLAPREHTMPYELSAEEMRMPLRAISITVPNTSRAAMLAQLQVFGRDTRFAIYAAPVDQGTHPSKIAAYRSDITFTGTLSADGSKLELMIYRTRRRVLREAVDQGVEGLREAFAALPDTRITQTVFVRGDDTRLDPRIPISAARQADFKVEDRHLEMVKRRLLRFAEQNHMAASWGQLSADPREFAIDLYGERINVFAHTFLSERKFGFGVYRTGDRSATEESLSELFSRLRQALEEVDGVIFIDESNSHR